MSWPVVKLHEICRPRQWKTIPASKLKSEGYPVYGANGKIGFYSEYTHQEPTLAITCRGATCGNVHISDPFSYINGNAMALDNLDNNLADIKYLYYFFLSRGFDDVISGSAQPQITGQGLTKVTVPLPPLNEQARIATILDKADAIRRKRQQAIQLADDFLKSVFLDMFGDPVTNPKGWDVEYWRDVLKIINGKNQKAVENPEGQFPICGSGGIMSYADNWLTKENSVIIGRKGNIHNPILMKTKFWNVDTAFGLEPVTSKLSHNFLFWFCKFFDFEKLNKAVTIPSLTKVDLLQISMPIPPLELQRKFDCVIEQIDRLLDKYGKGERQPIFQSLSQKAFAGEL